MSDAGVYLIDELREVVDEVSSQRHVALNLIDAVGRLAGEVLEGADEVSDLTNEVQNLINEV